MNKFLEMSIEYANQKNYLDDLFRVYPLAPDSIRNIDTQLWKAVETAFKQKDNEQLLRCLLKLKLFPIKDSYVAYLRRDKTALSRNPATVDRLCGRLYQMGINDIFNECSTPKETNRQIGPLFRRWLMGKSLGLLPVNLTEFEASSKNAVLDAGDAEMMAFAERKLNYKRRKGLDFIARFNGKYVIGEAKFLTDFGGHQNAQFADAITTLNQKNVKAITVAILDGVLYIKGKNKMYKDLTNQLKDRNVFSSLLLRDFLYQL